MGTAVADRPEAPRTWWTRTALIREKYGNPSGGGKSEKGGHSDYCVGGAFMRYYRYYDNGGFPGTDELARALQTKNTNLPMSRARDYASEIIRHNDKGDFCAAWDALERALTW
jgi:hypothetical protein